MFKGSLNKEVEAVISYYKQLGYSVTIPEINYWRGNATILTVVYDKHKDDPRFKISTLLTTAMNPIVNIIESVDQIRNLNIHL